MTEWRPIPGYTGYEASDEGQIRSLKTDPAGRVLVQRVQLGHGDYYRVSAHKDGDSRQRMVRAHRLVAAAWHGPLPEGMVTRHLDGDNTNNRPSNLAYGTHSANNRDQVRHGTDPNAKRSHCKNGHPWDDENTWLEWRPNADGVIRPTRRCRACWRMHTAAYAARKRQQQRAA